jgi:hypothetical protein
VPTSSVGSGSPAGVKSPGSPSFGAGLSTAPKSNRPEKLYPNKKTEMFPPTRAILYSPQRKREKAIRAAPSIAPLVPKRWPGPWRSSGTTSSRGPRSARPGGRRSSGLWARRCTGPCERARYGRGASSQGWWVSSWLGLRSGAGWAWIFWPQGGGRNGRCGKLCGKSRRSGRGGKLKRNSSGSSFGKGKKPDGLGRSFWKKAKLPRRFLGGIIGAMSLSPEEREKLRSALLNWVWVCREKYPGVEPGELRAMWNEAVQEVFRAKRGGKFPEQKPKGL